MPIVDSTRDQEFEDWYKTTEDLKNHKAIDYGTALNMYDGKYTFYRTQIAWEAWQQAKKSCCAFTNKDIDLFRQWYNSVYDTNPDYLEQMDTDLYVKIMQYLNMKVSPRDIKPNHYSYDHSFLAKVKQELEVELPGIDNIRVSITPEGSQERVSFTRSASLPHIITKET